MISCLSGVLFEIGSDFIILDVNGVGFEIVMHQRALTGLSRTGQVIFLYTHLQVLENEFKLYGFMDKEELKLFKKLLGVSGMGAKGAMNVLAFMEPFSFYHAIASADEKILIKIPGIGKKSAGRLIFELQDKIGELGMPDAVNTSGTSVEEDVLQALESLGYGRSEVYPLIMDLKKAGDLANSVEENIKKILRIRVRQMK